MSLGVILSIITCKTQRMAKIFVFLLKLAFMNQELIWDRSNIKGRQGILSL